MAFEDQIQKIKLQVYALPVNVLVWGPGQVGGEGYEKRLQIQRKLQERFPNADIRFSEELALSRVLPGKDLELHEEELWHLAACDVCVALDTSRGVGEEIAHFSTSIYAYKLWILSNRKYEDSSSFPASLRRHRNQIFYTNEEYESCSLLDRVVTRVEQVALGMIAGLKPI